MKKVKINDIEYEIIQNDDCINKEELKELITDYFDNYDYIFGDYAYGKIRLKGYYDSNNKKAKSINNIETLEDYKKEYCSYGAKTFLIKKVK